MLVTPEESDPPAVLHRANQLAGELATMRHRGTDALEWMASDAQLRALHMVMLRTVPERRKGEYDVDLLLGLAKLHDAASIEEASSLLSSREKLAVLGNQAGLERLSQLATVRGVHSDAVTSSRNPLGPHPPISPASRWCNGGTRHGGVVTNAVRSPVRPATLWIGVVLMASARVIAGRIVVSRRTSLTAKA